MILELRQPVLISIVLLLDLLGLKSESQNMTELRTLDMMLRNYDRRATPTFGRDEPTKVDVELFIHSFGSINPSTMDYEVDLYLRQYWVDPRLQHEDISTSMDLNDPNILKAIWKPEVYFPNAKKGEFQFVTVPNMLIRLNPGGQIFYMLRLKLLFACMMEVSKFPLDYQVCTMEIASFSKTLSELTLQWKQQQPVVIHQSLRMPQFEYGGVEVLSCDDEHSTSIGEYSCLQAAFTLRRALGFHLVQSYIPTMLIVMISWISFWMDVDSVPGRVTLGITTLLTMTTKSSGIQAEVPQVSYVKAIDIWMGVCTGFIFATLLEFTLVNYLWRKRPNSFLLQLDYTCNQELNNSNQFGFGVEVKSGSQLDSMYSRRRQFRGRAQSIDTASRVLFPLGFVIFNIIYWPYYLL